MSNVYLLINISIWIITLVVFLKKRKKFDVSVILLLSFLVYSISSFLHYNSSYIYEEIKIFPFIYLYLMIMLFLYPVFRNYDKNIVTIEKPNSKLFFLIALIYIISSILFFIFKINDIIDGIFNIITNPTAAVDIYVDKMDNSFDAGDGLITNLFAILSNIFSDIGILFYFYYLTQKNKNKYLLFGLFISIIFSIFSPLAQSQRGPAVERLLTVVVAYFALKDFIPISINKKIRKISLIIIILFTIPMASITIGRFGEREGGAKGSVFSYTGQANLNFNNYAFDNGGLRYGDRVFPLFKRILGFDDVPYNFWERRLKYPYLKINDEVFIGFVGDFVLDFGPLVATLIFILFTINAVIKTRIRNNTLLFHQLIFLYFIMCVSIQGGLKLFSFSDTGGNLRLIIFIFVYSVFKLNRFHTKNSL